MSPRVRRCAELVLVASAAIAGCAPAVAPRRAPATALLPARLRRLSNVEYERTANALTQLDESFRDELPPDERQDGYTVNERQTVTSYYAAALECVADKLAALAVARKLDALLPCPPSDSSSSTCVGNALDRLGEAAFRRPLAAEERSSLRALYDRGAAARASEGDSGEPRARGTELVLSTLLRAPSLVYVSELGGASAPATTGIGDVATLSSYEIASTLAYAVTGSPPDAELLAAAAEPGLLLGSEAREEQARRLLSRSSTRHHFREFVLEWLEVDQLARTAKASNLVANYDAVKAHMLGETRDFVDEVMVYGGASLRSLLNAGFTSLDSDMAAYYGIPGFVGPRVRLTAQRRVGVLEQASFLSAHAYEDVTSPVKRGDFVLRRVMCVDMKRPGEVGIETVMPPRDPHSTTRARFSAHTSNPMCQSCHATIDPLGFSFEGFDAAGQRRTREQGQPVVTAGSLKVGSKLLNFADSAELSAALSDDSDSRRCFARHALRYLTGRRDSGTEDWFESVVDGLPAEQRDSLLEWVVAWVRSPEFTQRRTKP